MKQEHFLQNASLLPPRPRQDGSRASSEKGNPHAHSSLRICTASDPLRPPHPGVDAKHNAVSPLNTGAPDTDGGANAGRTKQKLGGARRTPAGQTRAARSRGGVGAAGGTHQSLRVQGGKYSAQSNPSPTRTRTPRAAMAVQPERRKAQAWGQTS
ncbi:hypothetical protein P7K49_012519 [Saguinus oedipus]|uniref:Uncharacterized protein n=1 Tax=Saguinus oedipus TaxID=9490 RepID=A0ABQ9VTT8_SAGOE|nr:hypothetical protein P7K49_012519 [Saguinus oedipus]